MSVATDMRVVAELLDEALDHGEAVGAYSLRVLRDDLRGWADALEGAADELDRLRHILAYLSGCHPDDLDLDAIEERIGEVGQ